jgi:phosphohistidine phosphatase
MPKFLYLLRHAQSVEKQAGQADMDRELTPVGTKQTFQLGAYLHREKIQPDVIYCSNAVRARTTAQLISDTIKLDVEKIIPDEELSQASVRTFFEFISQLDDAYTRVMCVGHNPEISYLAEYLTEAEIGVMQPAGMAAIKLKIDSWKNLEKGIGEMMQYVSPDMLDSA